MVSKSEIRGTRRVLSGLEGLLEILGLGDDDEKYQ